MTNALGDVLKKPKIIRRSKKSARILEITLNGKGFSTPAYFPAISSFGIKFSFHDMLYLLRVHRFPRVLVSAYDLNYMEESEKRDALRLMKSYMKKGILFLDSGGFESSWKIDESWNVSSYKSTLSRTEFNLYSSFDVFRSDKMSYLEFKKETYNNVLESSVFLDNLLFLPILHESSPAMLIRLVKDFVADCPDMCSSIAVAERDIGKSIQERAETIVTLRNILNANDERNLLHILGCGNPYIDASIFLLWCGYF